MSGQFEILVEKNTPIGELLPRLNKSESNKGIAGIAVIVDRHGKVEGVVTDGDIRRGLTRGIALTSPIEEIANFSPFTVKDSESKNEVLSKVHREARRRKKPIEAYGGRIILVDDDNRFKDVVFTSDLMEGRTDAKAIAVHGLGFVGLTLASVMANSELRITGIDTNNEVIRSLNDAQPHFFENGLESLLKTIKRENPIHFTNSLKDVDCDIHIVTVGTPVDASGKPDLEHFKASTHSIADVIKKGDLVIYRSTVPVGTTRNTAIPILETSGLEAGKDFYVAFAPERTVEGNALRELRTLPQIVGGVCETSTRLASELFRRITPVTVELSTLEEAELVKLINNSFRDLVFSFSNEVSNICEGFNVDAFRVIEAANEGYPRDRVPSPSPGVGGICLSKDPFLFSEPAIDIGYQPLLGRTSRQINDQTIKRIAQKIEKYAERIGKRVEDCTLYVIGLAFKGIPETSDIRNSMSISLLNELSPFKKVRAKDFVVPDDVISSLEFEPIDDIVDGFKGADIVLVMNNHYDNNRFVLSEALGQMNKPGLLFDGWHLFNRKEVEKFEGISYATMGYITGGYITGGYITGGYITGGYITGGSTSGRLTT